MTKKRLVQVYTGDGKGKTTASLGLAMRAVGHGLKVYMIQFLKGNGKEGKFYGELNLAKEIPNLTIVQFGRPVWLDRHTIDEEDLIRARKGLIHAKEIISSKEYDIVILDEINVAMYYGLIDVKEVMDLIKNKPEEVEIVLTGRYAPKEIIGLADLVTEMKCIRHPYDEGIKSRKGIDR